MKKRWKYSPQFPVTISATCKVVTQNFAPALPDRSGESSPKCEVPMHLFHWNWRFWQMIFGVSTSQNLPVAPSVITTGSSPPTSAWSNRPISGCCTKTQPSFFTTSAVGEKKWWLVLHWNIKKKINSIYQTVSMAVQSSRLGHKYAPNHRSHRSAIKSLTCFPKTLVFAGKSYRICAIDYISQPSRSCWVAPPRHQNHQRPPPFWICRPSSLLRYPSAVLRWPIWSELFSSRGCCLSIIYIIHRVIVIHRYS